MAAEAIPYQNGAVSNGDLTDSTATVSKKSKEMDRRRRRRKQKKSNKSAPGPTNGNESEAAEENSDPQGAKVEEQVIVEYVPEKPELDDIIDDELREVFKKFQFVESVGDEEAEKKDESVENAAKSKKDDSDSDEEGMDNQQKEKGGMSNKKKKLLRRMKIAELKQISSRPDVVEVWDATSADPKLLVFLKSYRNTVPVPRHWCQKRKFLQESGCDSHGAWTCMCLPKGDP